MREIRSRISFGIRCYPLVLCGFFVFAERNEKNMYDFAVIGAGVVGGLIARELSKYDFKICILEKSNDVAMGSTKANSAIVHAGFDAENGTLKAKLNVRGSEMMKSLCIDLGVKYENNGSLVAAMNDGELEKINLLYQRGVKNGVKGLEILSSEQVKEKEPNINDNIKGALWAPTGAIVCPYELAIAAVGNAMDNGAELKRNFEVVKIEKEKNGFKIYSGGEFVNAKYIINSAGLYSDSIAEMCGDGFFKISPRRGEYILLDKECKGLVKSTVFRPPTEAGKGILISPTVDGNIILGPTSTPIHSKNDFSVTKSGLDMIIKSERENVKALPLNKSITSFCGLRAAGDTGDFIIEMRGNAVHLGGIESPGLSASPAIAEYVVEILKGSGLKMTENKSFCPTRKPNHYFKTLSDDEKNEIIKKDPRYGKIVCRCEEISEGEIVEAITRNPKALDADGVKRRTRSQMGRCQGGFCGPQITEIIARETGIDITEVTKFGGGSRLILKKTGKGGKADA